MITNIKSTLAICAMLAFGFSACKKTEYKFGDLKAPTNLTLAAVIAGVNTANPNGNGSGAVQIDAHAANALSYNIDFGDGITKLVPSGKIEYKYVTPGTTDYTITVNAIGTGGILSTISKRVTVFVAFQIPTYIVTALTNNASRKWETDKSASGHVGVGPNDQFAPIWYAADPNSRSACQYDDEITFSKDANDNISMAIVTNGDAFSIGAASAFYGFSGGDGCYAIATAGTRRLGFSGATSASTTSNSTRVQFSVPGNGFINFGTGGSTYEILSITPTSIHLRNIGIDGNAWYQKLRVKP
jgi:hypothetical protein